MTDILRQLSPAAWRAIEFPITGRDYGFSQQQARHKFIFRNNEIVESLGHESPTYRYTIPFREDIAVGPYAHLFVEVYPRFLAACQDDTAGVLDDPFHGPVQCKCVSLREVVSVERKDGIDVEAEFIVAPDPEDVLEDLGAHIATLQGAGDVAGLFDAQVPLVDWKQEPPPEPTHDIFDTISSIGDQLSVAGSKVTATLANVAFKMEKATASIDKLKNPNLAPLRQQARRLQLAALNLHDEATTPPRPTELFKTTAEIGVIALAGLCRMTLADFLRLNPGLPRTGRVPPRTSVKKYK